MTQKALSYDLGGTKVAVGVVNSDGVILDETRAPALFQQGKDAVIEQLIDLGNGFLRQHPDIKWVGMASAGPLNPITGELLDPTNFVSEKGSWGKVHITGILCERLKRPVFLENDAAAAILAEHWVGSAKGFQNAMILTLGTGLGTGVICNGELIRAGQHLHCEAGHMIVNYQDKTAPCGCGNLGCAEAYLSGRSFARRNRKRLNNPHLTAQDIANLARQGDPIALSAFEEYSEIMAVAIHNYSRIFCPEIIIFAGSFSAANDLFLPATQKHLERLLAREKKQVDSLPKLVVSKLENNSGLIGGAYVAFLRAK